MGIKLTVADLKADFAAVFRSKINPFIVVEPRLVQREIHRTGIEC